MGRSESLRPTTADGTGGNFSSRFFCGRTLRPVDGNSRVVVKCDCDIRGLVQLREDGLLDCTRFVIDPYHRACLVTPSLLETTVGTWKSFPLPARLLRCCSILRLVRCFFLSLFFARWWLRICNGAASNSCAAGVLKL